MTAASVGDTSRPGDDGAIVFAFVVVFAISIALMKVIPGPGSLDQMADPPTGPDRVPAGPVIETLPARCGVSAATLARLLPGQLRMSKDGAGGECSWSSADDDSRSRRSLSVDLTRYRDGHAVQYPGRPTGRSALGGAVKSFGPKWSDVTVQAVTGLGDEAVTQFSPTSGATVVTRVGNAKAEVRYSDYRDSLPKETAQDGAFAVAAEVLAGLDRHAPAHPAIAPATHPAPARKLPDLCEAVSERTLHRLVKEDLDSLDPDKGEGGLAVGGAHRRGCSWTTMERELKVSAAVIPTTGLFDGTWLATREYTILHADARAEETLSVHDKKYFRAVTGLGDQAFAAHVPGVIPGTVVFRDGGLLVQVTYEAADERKPLSREHAVRGAYAAATEVAQALPAG